MNRIFLFTTVLILATGSLFATAQRETEQDRRIGVFVPGFVAGSPTYEMLVDGARRAAEQAGVAVDVSEAGFNQAEWGPKLTELAATGRYDVIVTSNPAMPALAATVAESFPEQRFVCIDGYLEGNSQIYTVIFNQVEQAYLVGAMAGLVTTSDMPGATQTARVGLIVGQEYPVMNQAIRPGYEQGLRAVAPDAKIDFRVVGNWYDAAKAAELADGMFASGVDVILTIAGSASQGVIARAGEQGRYVLWFDSNGYGLAPGVVVGSSIVAHDRATYEAVSLALQGSLEYGKATILGVAEGYVRFIDNDPIYVSTVPPALRERMATISEKLQSGEITLLMPRL